MKKCVWKRTKGGDFSVDNEYISSCSGKQTICVWDWKFCPYCGKKIKKDWI